jgi:hypothetical protein
MDHDNGDTILYSGSGSKDNNDPVLPDITKDTAAMQTAHRLQKPIRVIRSSRSDWKYAPTIGCRYDGLYKIVKQTTPKNENGGAYVRFELKREENQPDYDLSRPTADEKRAFDRIQDYY